MMASHGGWIDDTPPKERDGIGRIVKVAAAAVFCFGLVQVLQFALGPSPDASGQSRHPTVADVAR